MEPAAMIALRYDGDGEFHALRRQDADAAYTVGEVYRMEQVLDPSDLSRRHEFAFLREAWKRLPADKAALYPSPEHLRKAALIEAGYLHEMEVDAGSAAAALRVAQAWRQADEFAQVTTRGPIVVRRWARSQSRRAMDRTTFQASKQAMLDVIEKWIGETPGGVLKRDDA